MIELYKPGATRRTDYATKAERHEQKRAERRPGATSTHAWQVCMLFVAKNRAERADGTERRASMRASSLRARDTVGVI